jgi:glucose-1-phosphatase
LGWKVCPGKKENSHFAGKYFSLTMQKPEAIIFDLGGVILDIDYNLTRKAFEDLGVKQFDEMYSQAGADKLFSNLEMGTVAEEHFYEELNRRTGLGLSPGEIKSAWCAMLLTFREESLQFLETLRPQYKTFLLSNTNHIHLPEFNKLYLAGDRSHPFSKYFDRAYYSCEMGMRKPEADIYEWVLSQEKLDPSKTVFVDDSLQNVEAARKAGMHGILLEPGMRIEKLDFSIPN